jgi:acyl-CoA dehydrogenase
MTYRSPWMTDELDQLRDLTRKFLARESEPNHERWTAQHAVDREFWNMTGELGLLCLACPEAYGGGGGTFAHEAVVMEEQARIADDCWAYAVHSTIVAPYIVNYGACGRHRHDRTWYRQRPAERADQRPPRWPSVSD